MRLLLLLACSIVACTSATYAQDTSGTDRAIRLGYYGLELGMSWTDVRMLLEGVGSTTWTQLGSEWKPKSAGVTIYPQNDALLPAVDVDSYGDSLYPSSVAVELTKGIVTRIIVSGEPTMDGDVAAGWAAAAARYLVARFGEGSPFRALTGKKGLAMKMGDTFTMTTFKVKRKVGKRSVPLGRARFVARRAPGGFAMQIVLDKG